ncbi:hypothetical protein F4810DRAFT_686508 [Camillea tinctor]|nr:hypothetical protein F4810DRAFT_686508 [Camillea tinctor]
MEISKVESLELEQARDEITAAGQVDEMSAQKGQYLRIDPEVERRVRRKIDWSLIPLVMGCCKSSFREKSAHAS